MTRRRIHIIAACAARKAVLPEPLLCLRSVAQKRLENRVAEWLTRIGVAEKTHRAVDLYQGEYWSVIRGLASGFDASLWIASAGYGLIPASRSVASYSATFSTSEPDSVAVPNGERDAPRRWWNLLRDARRGTIDVSRDDLFIVIASAAYVDAMSADLLAIRRHLPRREQFVVFSSFEGRDDTAWLHEHTVRMPASARKALGGTAGTVGARGAVAYLRDQMVGLPAHDVEEILIRKYAPTALETINRHVMTDAQIKAWIGRQLRGRAISTSAALRAYRDSGHACEQARFGRLYRTIADHAK